MTNQERWELYENGELRQDIAIELLDWAGYWSGPGVIDSEITDDLLKRQTRQAVKMILEDISYCIRITVGMFISDDDVKNASVEDITEALIHTVIVRIMATKLEWLTGISE